MQVAVAVVGVRETIREKTDRRQRCLQKVKAYIVTFFIIIIDGILAFGQ
jgi:hypothetical protein